MLDELRGNDQELNLGDIRQLESADEVARLFARLGYNVDRRINIPDIGAVGLGSAELRYQIQRLEQIATDPQGDEMIIYLLEVRSVTVRLRNELARRFRERSENALLVLTIDYAELEFLLIDRRHEPSRSKLMPLKLVVRPIPLTVNRINPDPLALRVLKRFSFTEADPGYQWEKLRSAYALAEWSEEYFNNRALFSDYYLKQRLTDPRLTPQWDEDVRPVARQVFKHLASARPDYTSQPSAVIRAGLYEPLFKLLGFDATAPQAGSPTERQADYLLFDPADPAQPIAATLTYVWSRNLDDVDETREPAEAAGGRPLEIPGATVVSLLESAVAPWVIVTNGKLWRLYSATASNKATNYYEIDLEEAFAATDQVRALKYWWLLFRRQAFTGFLAALLKNSADYAKELGERLKDRVFVEIFPQFARGFVANLRTQGSSTLDDATLALVFAGTLTFLYRLMFILYAESLDLLPINEAHGYRDQSLDLLKKELAEVGGTLLDESPTKLRHHYSATSTALYDRITALCTVIDRGSEALNMPTYNGGLFSPTTPEGEFLASYAIPDSFLALGLDRLARDVDTRTHALVMIDFKSLGVRQLGSIYEGLLEFKLHSAAEKLAVTKVKGKEVYQPFASVKQPLAIIEPGEVYLLNDKKERKATGSYYTPDYIVKYIVQHTVGPILDRNFEQLAPRLRSAQKDYRAAAKLAQARGGTQSPALFWHNPAMQRLVDDCLNLRVLDPAMGSGHFLVEVVDYVSNRLISFLNGWSENPVWALIEQTRSEIGQEMERQQVTIDADRLTRVALLKRSVLKRCIYGVDLNAMAVELAKVSLWLDAFTLGAPLSFLDHHLKHGNSLIGARIKDVQQYLDVGGSQMHLLEGSEFSGIMLGTDLMRQVSYLSDNTVEQSQLSAAAYRGASDHLAPYKRMLDVYTSRWFGNQQAKKAKTDLISVFLRDPSTRQWLNDPTTPLSDALIPASTLAATTLSAAHEKRFFHWELEFPEVFFAPSTPGGQDVQLIAGGGFDAVVGNPPWIDVQEIDESTKPYLSSNYSSATGKYDLYAVFVESSLSRIQSSGLSTMIFQSKFLVTDYGQGLRQALANKAYIHEIFYTGIANIFEDITTYPIVMTISRKSHNDSSRDFSVVFVPAKNSKLDYELAMSNANFQKNFTFLCLRNTIHNDQPWILEPEKVTRFVNRIIAISIPFKTFVNSISYGVKTNRDDAYIGEKKFWLAQGIEEELLYPTAKPRDLGRYEIEYGDRTIIFPYIFKNDRLYPINLNMYPGAQKHFHSRKEDLLKRLFFGKTIIEQGLQFFELPYTSSYSQNAKLVFPKVTNRALFAIDEGSSVVFVDPCYVVALKNDINIYFLAAILNSHLIDVFLKRRSTTLANEYTEMMKQYVEDFPIRRIAFTTPTAERERLVQRASAAYDLGDHASVLHMAQAALEAEQTDVVHDLLAELAQRMIDLNKAKQTEVKRFLGGLEARLRIRADKSGAVGIASLKGKSIIQNYLGDYQKGQAAVAWRDFLYRLHENRMRYPISLSDAEGQIEGEYAASLATLLPIKRDLARTDALIDKLVYRLYGLTEAEIELIERPQYEQALTEAKAQVVADDQLTDDEVKISMIAEAILPAAERFFERVEPVAVEDGLDRELPGWRTLPPAAPTFLLTGDYNLRMLPEHMDFSSSVIPYTKAVEVVLDQRIFAPFRESYTDSDCANPFLQRYMRGEKELTLGSYMIILSSSRETALRSFIARQIPDAAQRVFGPDGLVISLDDSAMRDIRNKAAHDEVLTRLEAQQVRDWALGILGRV